MIEYSKYKKGSEWRKWDLHVHTASSYDAYKGEDANELLTQAWIDNEFAAVAVTDHFLIDAERIQALREMAPTVTIFPGVELRTDKGANNLHVILIFSEKADLSALSENFRVIMLNQKAKANDNDDTIYWDFNDIIEFANQNDGLISLHTGSKTQGMDDVITNSMPVNMAIKREIANYSHFYEIGKVADVKTHIDKIFPHIGFKPLILCSDNHDPRDYKIKENLWVKSDPTFEGLKQLIYEPQERVAVQEDKPDEKRGYYAIDSVVLNEAGFWNQSIKFSENLNTVIGGRATGKSTLLSCIAEKGGTHVQKDFIKQHSVNLQIKWKDGEVDTQRDIDFFPQSYMYNIATDTKSRDLLIERIIEDYDTHKFYETYRNFVTSNKNILSQSTRTLFNLKNEIIEIYNIIKQKGDKQGIDSEIKKLNEKIQKSKVSISNETLEKYNTITQSIFEKENKININNSDLNQIQYISAQPIFNESFQYNFSSLSESIRSKIILDYEAIKKEVNDKWQAQLTIRKNGISQENDLLTKEINNEKTRDDYILGQQLVENNKQYQELTERLKAEKSKYEEILSIEEQLKTKRNELNALKLRIITEHLNFRKQIYDLKETLALESSGIEIKPRIFLKKNDLKDFLISRLNQQGKERQEYVTQLCDNYLDNTEDEIKLFLHNVLNDIVDFKSGNNSEEVAVQFFSSNWFGISFDLIYQNDEFKYMSQGKQSFVILKLLLEFSKKECPILIDQPEDSLDNRAIYNELVKYLIDKKKKRQIILVTHNSNVVVSADAEQIIVANQHGQKNPNIDGYKFQYVSGGLEYTKAKDNDIDFTLISQGIREHVCEILEGGNEAFKKREQKYGI